MFGNSRKKRYLRWRAVNYNLSNRIFETLTRSDIMEGARNLGLLQGRTFVFDNETEMGILMDHCNYDLRRRDKRNAVERFAHSNAELTDEERAVLDQMCQVRFCLFQVVKPPHGITFEVLDLLRLEPLTLMDVGLSRTIFEGFVMACHTIPTGIDDCWATSGVGLPIDLPEFDEILDKLRSVIPSDADIPIHLKAAEWSSVARIVFRTALRYGCSERVAFAPPVNGLSQRSLGKQPSWPRLAGT